LTRVRLLQAYYTQVYTTEEGLLLYCTFVKPVYWKLSQEKGTTGLSDKELIVLWDSQTDLLHLTSPKRVIPHFSGYHWSEAQQQQNIAMLYIHSDTYY